MPCICGSITKTVLTRIQRYCPSFYVIPIEERKCVCACSSTLCDKNTPRMRSAIYGDLTPFRKFGRDVFCVCACVLSCSSDSHLRGHFPYGRQVVSRRWHYFSHHLSLVGVFMLASNIIYNVHYEVRVHYMHNRYIGRHLVYVQIDIRNVINL